MQRNYGGTADSTELSWYAAPTLLTPAKLIPRNDVRSEEDVRGGGPPGHFYVSVHFTRVMARFLQVFIL
jgi:hypothetical protein